MNPMSDLYLDIETIPTQRPDIIERVTAGITAPAQYKKPDSIAKWLEENAEDEREKRLHKTGLNGTFGEIVCISFAVDDGPIITVSRSPSEPETELLKDFFRALALHTKRSGNRVRWIGHNITGFDLRFLWQRCVVNRVKPSIPIPYDAKPWSESVYDTYIEWAGLRGEGSLDDIMLALGGKGKGDMDGSMVWGLVREGRMDEVIAYCEDDVRRVRLAHERMTFRPGGE